jgi:pimeloyl-ACP methyl ester carboxylesterase
MRGNEYLPAMRIVLVPGAGGAATYWSYVVPRLVAAGHDVRTVDLPGDDSRAGLEQYAERVLEVVGDNTVVAAQSMGGFTAAIVAARAKLARLIFVNAMIPNPNETPGAWWKTTGHEEARVAAARAGGYDEAFDLATYFLHDVPADVLASIKDDERDEAAIAFGSPCNFDAWPDIPIHVIGGADDRFFPIEFQRRLARERLGREIDVVPGGHLCALSRPRELATAMLATMQRGRTGLTPS